MISISFQTAFIAIFQIFLMGALGFFLVRRCFLDENGLKMLSWLSVNVIFPFYIFNQIINHFDPSTQPNWWAYPLINIGVCFTGLILTGLIVIVLHNKNSKEWMAVSSFHNAGYIPLLLVTVLPFGEKIQELYSYIILTIVGFDLCLWSLGAWLIAAHHNKANINWKSFINPPLVSMFLAFMFVLFGGKELIPEIVAQPIKIMGDGALGIAMLIIGGNLALTIFDQIQWKNIMGAVAIKLIILPILALLFLRIFHISSVWGFVLMIQACMPTSITLSVFGRYYDNPKQNLINQTIFITHLLCGLTIPLFLGLYGSAKLTTGGP